MYRRDFFKTGSLAAIGGALVGTNATAAEKESGSSGSVGVPVIMAPRYDGAEIVWTVPALRKGYVEYGESEKLGEVERNDGWGVRPAGETVVRVRLSGLKPGTEYHFRAVTESFDRKNPAVEKGEVFKFKTLDKTAKASSFVVWNDTHKREATLKKLAEVTPAADFMLWNGDISNDWYKEEDLAASLLNPANGQVRHSHQHPLFIVRGNHDLRGTYAFKLEDYVAMPEGKPWFAFRQGPVASVCMDTGEDKADDHPGLLGRVASEPMRQEQADWLAKVIETPEFKNAPYRIVFCHIPLRGTNESAKTRYDHFSRRSRELWHEHLVKWGAQLVISGHTHTDAFLPADEKFPYAQLIGGGPQIEHATLIHGEASEKQCIVTCKGLDGKERHKVALKPIA